MSTPATTQPHPWELLLEQLTGRMGITHGFGTEDDAKAPPFDRICWIPKDIEFADAGWTPEYAQATQWLEGNLLARVYGATPAEVYGRVAELAGWIDVLVGPEQGDPESEDRLGYKLGKGSGPIGGLLPASTWFSDVPITLRSFVVRAFTPPATILSATVQVDAADSDGAEQAIPVLAGDP